MRIPVALALLLVACNSIAAWYEASGVAAIDGDVAAARQAAINDAVRNALLYAGMELHSSQLVANGVLAREELSWSSHASVHDIRLLSETHSGNRLTVQIHAELRPSSSDCKKPRASRKRMKLGDVRLREAMHAQQGGLYHLGRDSQRELLRQLQRQAGQRLALSDQPDAPYRAEISIIDASMLGDFAPNWQWWQEPPKRALRLLLDVRHSHSGEVVLQQEYAGSAVWGFKPTETVDSSSQRYWQSAYGNLNRTLLEQMARDLNSAFACKPLYGRVTSVQGKRLWLDVGVNDGVNQGFIVNLYKTRQFLEADGSVTTVLLAEPRTLRISGVDGDRSFIELDNVADAFSYQAGDQIIEP